MKLNKLKRWSLFYNTNNYLCLVYKIEHHRIHIINHNGTVYTVSRESECSYRQAEPEDTPEYFFMNFPACKFSDYRDRQRYEEIKSKYYVKSKSITKLLLLC